MQKHPGTTGIRHSLPELVSRVSNVRLAWGLVALYAAVVVGLSLYDFLVERHRRLDRIDSTLRAASFALDRMLGADFHDRYHPGNPVPPDEFRRITLDLNRFARDLGVEYVYTMVRSGGQVRFVVSNETHDDSVRGTPSLFYNPYPQPPRELLDAFASVTENDSHYASYTNVWDSFHSIFVPRTSPGGLRYVLAADVKIKDQRAVLMRCLYRDAALVLLLLVPLLPLILSLKALLRSREELAARDRRHMDELAALNRGLEETVAARTASLEKALDDLRAFSYTASHDLRAPLNAICGFAQILREELDDRLEPDHRNLLGRIADAGFRMSQLIERLLQLAQSPDMSLSLEDVALAPLVGEVFAELESGGGTFGATLELDADVALRADPALLRLLVQNLLSNACKFSRDRTPPRVAVRAGLEGGVAWFEVADNGEGFTPEQTGRLFRPFGRLHGSRYEGFGFGLAHVSRIVERHGWSIRADSVPGQGATFRVDCGS